MFIYTEPIYYFKKIIGRDVQASISIFFYPCYSLFVIRYLLFVIRYLLFVIRKYVDINNRTLTWYNGLIIKYLDIPCSVLDIGHLLICFRKKGFTVTYRSVKKKSTISG